MMMTYSAQVKNELCNIPLETRCDVIAETFGILMFANHFSSSEIRLSTSNLPLKNRIDQLFWKTFGLTLHWIDQQRKCSVMINRSEDLATILQVFGLDPKKKCQYSIKPSLAGRKLL